MSLSSLALPHPWLRARRAKFSPSYLAFCRSPLRGGLDDADQVAFGVGELGDLDTLGDLLGAHHAGAAETLGLGERGLDVGHLDVEGDVAAVALRALADTAAEFDEGGSIGKRYRRQDEIGTPWGVTVDGQTMEDDTVTLRDRDTLEQTRVPISELADDLAARLTSPWRSPKLD
jgi:Anticodon binding domain